MHPRLRHTFEHIQQIVRTPYQDLKNPSTGITAQVTGAFCYYDEGANEVIYVDDYSQAEKDYFLKLASINNIVYRPNHGLSHVIKTSATYLPFVVYYLKKFGLPDIKKYIKDQLQTNQNFILKLQIAEGFYAVGRQSEVSFSANPTQAMKYREAAAKHFKEYLSITNNDGLFALDEIDSYEEALKNAGDRKKDGTNTCFLKFILSMAHTLDLMRCYTDERLESNEIPYLLEYVEVNDNSKNHLKLLFLLAECCIHETDDNLHATVSGPPIVTVSTFPTRFLNSKTYYGRQSLKFLNSNTDIDKCISTNYLGLALWLSKVTIYFPQMKLADFLNLVKKSLELIDQDFLAAHFAIFFQGVEQGISRCYFGKNLEEMCDQLEYYLQFKFQFLPSFNMVCQLKRFIQVEEEKNTNNNSLITRAKLLQKKLASSPNLPLITLDSEMSEHAQQIFSYIYSSSTFLNINNDYDLSGCFLASQRAILRSVLIVMVANLYKRYVTKLKDFSNYPLNDKNLKFLQIAALFSELEQQVVDDTANYYAGTTLYFYLTQILKVSPSEAQQYAEIYLGSRHSQYKIVDNDGQLIFSENLNHVDIYCRILCDANLIYDRKEGDKLFLYQLIHRIDSSDQIQLMQDLEFLLSEFSVLQESHGEEPNVIVDNESLLRQLLNIKKTKKMKHPFNFKILFLSVEEELTNQYKLLNRLYNHGGSQIVIDSECFSAEVKNNTQGLMKKVHSSDELVLARSIPFPSAKTLIPFAGFSENQLESNKTNAQKEMDKLNRTHKKGNLYRSCTPLRPRFKTYGLSGYFTYDKEKFEVQSVAFSNTSSGVGTRRYLVFEAKQDIQEQLNELRKKAQRGGQSKELQISNARGKFISTHAEAVVNLYGVNKIYFTPDIVRTSLHYRPNKIVHPSIAPLEALYNQGVYKARSPSGITLPIEEYSCSKHYSKPFEYDDEKIISLWTALVKDNLLEALSQGQIKYLQLSNIELVKYVSLFGEINSENESLDKYYSQELKNKLNLALKATAESVVENFLENCHKIDYYNNDLLELYLFVRAPKNFKASEIFRLPDHLRESILSKIVLVELVKSLGDKNISAIDASTFKNLNLLLQIKSDFKNLITTIYEQTIKYLHATKDFNGKLYDPEFLENLQQLAISLNRPFAQDFVNDVSKNDVMYNLNLMKKIFSTVEQLQKEYIKLIYEKAIADFFKIPGWEFEFGILCALIEGGKLYGVNENNLISFFNNAFDSMHLDSESDVRHILKAMRELKMFDDDLNKFKIICKISLGGFKFEEASIYSKSLQPTDPVNRPVMFAPDLIKLVKAFIPDLKIEIPSPIVQNAILHKLRQCSTGQLLWEKWECLRLYRTIPFLKLISPPKDLLKDFRNLYEKEKQALTAEGLRLAEETLLYFMPMINNAQTLFGTISSSSAVNNNNSIGLKL